VNRILYVFLGGGAGSVARYLTAIVAERMLGPNFPFGTLTVNLVGCFLIGAINGVAMLTSRISPDARLFLTTGVLGGLTTYSAFNYDALRLFEQGATARASIYAAVTILGCAAAGVLGTWTARALVGPV
jgi:CrcB protein